MGIPLDGTGINCYGMGQINMSHGQPWWIHREWPKGFYRVATVVKFNFNRSKQRKYFLY